MVPRPTIGRTFAPARIGAGFPLKLTAACAALFAAAAGAASFEPQDLRYRLTRGPLDLGEARVTLAAEGGEDCYRYRYVARPGVLVRLFIGTVRETSLFCVVDGRIRSKRFDFERSDRHEDDFTLEFDWADRVVRSNRGELVQLGDAMIDRLAMQLAVQRWVKAQNGEPGPAEYWVTKVEDFRAKAYRFRIVAREKLRLPGGEFDTVRVERVDDTRKSTRFWLAPAQGYRAVRVEQTQEGDGQLSLELK